MTDINWQEAATEAVKSILMDALTDSLTVNELGTIFGMSYRPMMKRLDEIPGVIKTGRLYQIPLRHCPAHYIADTLPNLALPCLGLKEATQTLLDGVETDHAITDRTTTGNAATSHSRRPQHTG